MWLNCSSTHVCIDHLSGSKRLPAKGRLGYSVITCAELIAGAGDEGEASVRRFLAGMDEYRSIARSRTGPGC